jgi:REP element-mobilizing transposase RayT
MPSTHLSLHYHLVFGTKDHERLIHKSWRPRLDQYLGGVVTTLGGVPQAIGGVSDHVHLLVGLRATHCLADVLREIKSVSSAWVDEELRVPSFAWQEGYGGFGVSPSQRESVRAYILSQEQHHRTRTFREEYLELLTRNAVDFDERYVF